MALGKLGKYERVDVLGHGVSGIVYLAWDTLLKKQVALKEIDLQASDVNRFLEEARVIDRLQHPNIVRVNGVDMIEGHVVIDMEYVKGQNLQELLRRDGRLPLDRTLRITTQTLDALDYAHRMRTVHRDIKPANILVDREDCVKLVDFGLAEILSTNSYAGGAGTYAYMAPEDFEDRRSDHQSDIWAVGVTLYEMLTAARPFNPPRVKDPFAWRRALMTETPAPLSEHVPDVPPALERVMARALARDKQDRYQSAGEFRDDLQAILDHREPAHLRTLVMAGGSTRETAPPRPAAGSIATPVGMFTVAEPPSIAERPRSLLPSLLRPKEVKPAHVVVQPQSVYFGELRKGEQKTTRIVVRIVDGEGPQGGAVASGPAWAHVSPPRFDGRRQTLTITALSEQVWQTGDFDEPLRLDTSAGRVEIPLRMRVLPARPRFSDIAIWFIPVLASVALPLVTAMLLSVIGPARYLVPAAALASSLLAAMLLMVCREADLGIEERIGTGLLLSVMVVILGAYCGIAQRTGSTQMLTPLIGTGVPIGGMLLFQNFARKHWKLWSLAIVVLSLLACGSFIAAVSG